MYSCSQDGQIDSRELQSCLTNSGIAGTYQPFNLETCTLMINMLDRDFSGQMGFSEFKELWGVLNQWKVGVVWSGNGCSVGVVKSMWMGSGCGGGP